MAKSVTYNKFFSTLLLQDVPDNLRGEARLDCPLEGCPNPTEHFYANMDTSQWHCKRCDQSGNAVTLATLIHKQYFNQTTERQHSFLSGMRGLAPDTLDNAGFAYDADNDRWLVPYYTYDLAKNEWSDYLNNIGYFFPSTPNAKTRYKIKKLLTPLKLYNPGMHSYPPSARTIILEGEWDTLAYLEMFPDSEDYILGKPGSGFSNIQLADLNTTEELYLYLDNDAGGKQQTASVIAVAKERVPSIYVVNWDSIPGSAKDVRELYMNNKEGAPELLEKNILQYDIGRSVEKEISGQYQTSIAEYSPIESFGKYIEEQKKILYITSDTVLSMAAVFGMTNSISIPGEPLWAFLIGPPSSGKTTFIDSFGGNNELFDNLSKISAKALVSGWKDETGQEPSYLAKLKDKSLFVKDFTVTLSESPEAQKEVFGLLTDIFDGYVKIPYGNNEVREFHDLYFNMIAGVTDKVHAHSAATIGERFLRIDWLGEHYDSRAFGLAAFDNFGKQKTNRESLISKTLGMVNLMRTMPIPLEIPDQYKELLLDLAEFIAIIRTKVEYDRLEGMKYRARAELPSRLATQLAKLFVATRTVYNSDPDDEESTMIASRLAFEVTKKVALDTCYGFSLDILKVIAADPYATREQLAVKANVHTQRAYRTIKALQATDVISSVSGHAGAKGGRPKHHYAINPKLLAVLHSDKLLGIPGGIEDTKKRPKPKRPPSRPRPKRPTT